MSALGRRRWAISAGHAPSASSGPEPAFTSRDELSLLNTGGRHANVRLSVFYAGRAPVQDIRIVVAPRRLRRLRINDLIFPEPVRLDEPYGLLIESDEPVVAQFTRQDTRQRANAGLLAGAWPG